MKWYYAITVWFLLASPRSTIDAKLMSTRHWNQDRPTSDETGNDEPSTRRLRNRRTGSDQRTLESLEPSLTSDPPRTTHGHLRSLGREHNSFTCTPPEIMGLCTATEVNENDECSKVGEPCDDNVEHCCVDNCGRKYCTAKGTDYKPIVQTTTNVDDHDDDTAGEENVIQLDMDWMTNDNNAAPTNSPTATMETMSPTPFPSDNTYNGDDSSLTVRVDAAMDISYVLEPIETNNSNNDNGETSLEMGVGTMMDVRIVENSNSFTCTPPEIMGICTAPDPTNGTDECFVDEGESCPNGNEGEHCCVDLCGRKYCTAKGMWRSPKSSLIVAPTNPPTNDFPILTDDMIPTQPMQRIHNRLDTGNRLLRRVNYVTEDGDV